MNEATEPVDNLGGLLSLVVVGALILAINFAPVPNARTLTLVLAVIALVGLFLFYRRQRRAANALYDLDIAARPPFWVAACAGVIVFGSLMGAMFIGQQYLQNVLGYSTLDAGLAILPAAAFMVVVAPAVDLRCAADGRIRFGCRSGDRLFRHERHHHRPERADEIVRQRSGHRTAVPGSGGADRERRQDGLSAR